MYKKYVLALVLLVLTTVSGAVFSQNKPIIDDSEKDSGVVHITYKATDKVPYRVLIVKGEERLVYPFFPNGKTDSFPLQLGNGTYTVGLLKNVGDNRFVFVEQKKVTITLKDSNVVFLNSIQNVKWEAEEDAIVFGQKLIGKVPKNSDLLKKLYDYMVTEIKYDYDKIPTLTSEYVPVIAKTYVDKKGICYDYSALLASIKRSQGIPTKLVKGYTKFTDGYHAWNEVFIDGEWYIIDTTVDATLSGGRTKIQMVKNTKDYTKVNEY